MRAVMTRSVPGTSFAGRARATPMPRHILHRPVPAHSQPFEQPLLLAAEVGAGDADLLKAELLAPAANVGSERVPIPIAFGERCGRQAHRVQPTPCPRESSNGRGRAQRARVAR
jgi:hypothetical protein